MSQNHTGNVQPALDNEEHDHLPGKVAVKKVGNYVWNGSDWERLDTDAIEPNKIMAGPLEDTGYNYIGYRLPSGTYMIKRQNLTTTLWGYTYFSANFSTNWTNRASLTYGEPNA